MPDANALPGALARTVFLLRTSVQRVFQVLLTGFVIVLPFVLLGLLVRLTLDFTHQLLEPVIAVLQWSGLIRMANVGLLGDFLVELGLYEEIHSFFVEFVAVLTLLGVVVALGIFASFREGERAMAYVDHGISAIPGFGPVYESFRRVGNILLEDGLEEFQSVKLVEFPHRGCYSLAFETSRAPESVRTATGGDDLVSLFVPFAPNPVMGGFLVHVPRARVIEVEMTVEEAGRAIITSGFAAGEDRPGRAPST